MRYYEDRLKKLNEEKEKIEKAEKTFWWIKPIYGAIYGVAQLIADTHIFRLATALIFVAFSQSKNDYKDNNKQQYFFDIGKFIGLILITSTSCEVLIKKLVNEDHNHKSPKEALEKKIENTSKKIEKMQNYIKINNKLGYLCGNLLHCYYILRIKPLV